LGNKLNRGEGNISVEKSDTQHTTGVGQEMSGRLSLSKALRNKVTGVSGTKLLRVLKSRQKGWLPVNSQSILSDILSFKLTEQRDQK